MFSASLTHPLWKSLLSTRAECELKTLGRGGGTVPENPAPLTTAGSEGWDANLPDLPSIPIFFYHPWESFFCALNSPGHSRNLMKQLALVHQQVWYGIKHSHFVQRTQLTVPESCGKPVENEILFESTLGAFPCYLLRGNVLGLVLFLWWISDSHRGKISFFGSWFLGFQSMVSWFSYCEHQKRVNSLVPVDNHTEMGKKGQGKRGGKMGEKKKKVRARYPLKYTHTHTPIPISSNQTPSYTGLPFFSNTLFEIQVHQWWNHWWKQRPHDSVTSPKLTFIHCSYGNSRPECISVLEDTA